MTDLDFTDETISKLLFKKVTTDKKYLASLASMFDQRWFDDRNMRAIFQLTVAYFKKYQAIPGTKIIQALAKKYVEKSGIPYDQLNAALIDASTYEINITEPVLVSNLKEFFRRKALYFAISDNIQDIEKTGNVDKCLARFDAIQKLSFRDHDLGLNYFDTDSMAKHWDFIMNPAAKISTQWRFLDDYTNGGFLRDGKMLALFMAQAGLGKSVFMSNLAVNFLRQNLSVVVISLEMSQDVYAQRFDAHISKDNVNKLMETAEQSKKKIVDFYNEHKSANLIIKEYPPRSIKTNDIKIYLDNLKSNGYKFDVLIIDYLNLVLPNTKTDSMYKDGLSVSEELRGLSYEYNVPVISAVQCNSEGMNSEEIDMQNVSESRGIVHTADFLAGIYQLPDDREDGVLHMRLIKNRLGGHIGQTGRFRLDSSNLVVCDDNQDMRDISTPQTDREVDSLSAAVTTSSDFDEM